jgi:hypothetical protein
MGLIVTHSISDIVTLIMSILCHTGDAIMLSAVFYIVMPSVIMLNGFMLNVVAPKMAHPSLES